MTNFQTMHNPEWETTENGWRAVVNAGNNAEQWTAFVEVADAALWRIWAGRTFKSVKDAQDWCKAEIDHQCQRNNGALEDDGRWVWGNVEPMHNNDFMAY